MGLTQPLLCLFSFISQYKVKYITNLTINDKSVMGCLGVKPGAEGWKAQTNPLSYGGTPMLKSFCLFISFSDTKYEEGTDV